MHDSNLIDQYVRWLETLTASGAGRASILLAKDVRHRTPESEGAGPAAVAAIFVAMFNGTAGVKTKVTDRAAGQDGHTVYLRWDRIITFPNGKFSTMSGVSEVMVNTEGKISSIIDHWDTAPEARRGFFARLFKR